MNWNNSPTSSDLSFLFHDQWSSQPVLRGIMIPCCCCTPPPPPPPPPLLWSVMWFTVKSHLKSNALSIYKSPRLSLHHSSLCWPRCGATRHRVSCDYRCVTQQNADNSNVACARSADYCVTHYTSLSQNRIILSWLDARSLFININNKQLRYSQLDGGTFQCEFNRIHSTLSIFYIRNMFKNLFSFTFYLQSFNI